MLRMLIGFILYRIIGFHRHEWSKWEIREFTTVRGNFDKVFDQALQVRECSTCKLKQTRAL